jgi:hypothetical protein
MLTTRMHIHAYVALRALLRALLVDLALEVFHYQRAQRATGSCRLNNVLQRLEVAREIFICVSPGFANHGLLVETFYYVENSATSIANVGEVLKGHYSQCH